MESINSVPRRAANRNPDGDASVRFTCRYRGGMMNVLRQVTYTDRDLQFLWDMLAARSKNVSISHHAMPEWKEHVAFVVDHCNPRYHIAYKAWYIIAVDGKDAGQVYLTALNEIGVHISAKYQRNGLGSWAVLELMKRHPEDEYLANVAPDNEASHAFWNRLRGKIVQVTYRIKGGSCP